MVPGGGVTLLYATRAIDSLCRPTPMSGSASTSSARRCGLRSGRSPRTPGRTVRSSSANCWNSTDINYGYDAQTGEFIDLLKAGIIDPTKVVRIALQDAASISGLMITTEAMVVDKQDGKAASAQQGGVTTTF